MLQLKFGKPLTPSVYRYDPLSPELPKRPLLAEPYELRTLYIAESTLKGFCSFPLPLVRVFLCGFLT